MDEREVVAGEDSRQEEAHEEQKATSLNNNTILDLNQTLKQKKTRKATIVVRKGESASNFLKSWYMLRKTVDDSLIRLIRH